MNKNTKSFHNKTLYLLGKGEDGTFYYLEGPSWDCDWYWGFGYIQGFAKKSPTDRGHQSHEHADKFMSEWFTEWNGSKPRLKEKTFSEEEGWKLSELFKRFYILKDSAAMFGKGGAHVSGTDEYLKLTQWANEINTVLIPETTKRIIGILSENKDDDICEKCGEIHDVEKAGGHDLIQADTVLRCECSEHPDDEFCRQVLKNAYGEYEAEDKEKKREEAMGYDKPLRDLLTSENPAIVRLAKGIKKEFTK